MSLPHVRQHTINCEDEDFHRPLQGDLGFDDKVGSIGIENRTAYYMYLGLFMYSVILT